MIKMLNENNKQVSVEYTFWIEIIIVALQTDTKNPMDPKK